MTPGLNIIGREIEKQIISNSLKKALNHNGQTLLITGEAGIGKTTLVNFLKQEAEKSGMSIYMGDSSQQDFSTPYHPFQIALAPILTDAIFQTEEYAFFNEVFLINKSGLLISHVSRSKEEGLDEDILGSMLTAVQDFVKDSFGDSGSESQKGGLGKLEYMNTKIFIEHGDLVYMAAVTSGEEHPDMKMGLRNCLAEIEEKFFDLLKDWNGDIDALSGTVEVLNKSVAANFRVKRSLENLNLENERLKTENRILETLEKNSNDHGILLVLEDIHWADISTIHALPYLARNISDKNILFCFSLRSGDVNVNDTGQRKIMDALMSETAFTTTLNLVAIDQNSIGSIAASTLGGDMPPDELIVSLKAGTDGNPFFIIEAIRALIAEGTLYRDDDVWVLKHGPKSAIPSSVSDLVSRRIETLDLDQLRFVEYAAVLGRRFDQTMLATGFSVDKIMFDRIVNSLAELNILTKINHELMFQHSKTQEVIYSGLSGRWRKALHRNAGINIEAGNRDDLDSVLFSLAYHFSNAQDSEKGIDYCLSAGKKAMNNLAAKESIHFFEKAIDLIVQSGKSDDRAPDVYESLGDLYELDGNYLSAIGSFDRVLDLSTDENAQIRMMMKKGRVFQSQSNYDLAMSKYENGIALAEKFSMPFWKAKINGYLGKIFLRKGMYSRALELQLDYLKECKVINDPRELGQSNMNVGGVYYYLKDYTQAISYWKKARDYFEAAKYDQGIAFVNDNLGGANQMLGKLNESLEYYQNSETIMNKIGDVKGLSMVLNNMGALYDDLGDYSTSLKLYGKSLQIKKRNGDLVGEANIYNNIGTAHFNMGEYDEALRNYKLNYQLMAKSGDIWGVSQALNNIAEVELELGHIAKSKMNCMESLELAQKHSFKEIQATVYRHMGSIAALEGDMSNSARYFDMSLTIAYEIEEPQKIGLIHMAKARTLRNINAEQSIDSFAKALEVFDRANMGTMAAKVRKEMQNLVDASR